MSREDWIREPSREDWEALKAELAYYDREPAPFDAPKGPDGRVLGQFRSAEYGIAPEGRGW